MKKIVIPGDIITSTEMNIPNTYNENGVTYATTIGMVDETGRYVPLRTIYAPRSEDIVIGIVVGVRSAGYSVDLGISNYGFIPSRFLKRKLSLGDFVVANIRTIADNGDIDLGDVRKLPTGKMVEFPTAKIARLIGRQSSMLNLIKEAIGGDVVVGNNGYIWVSEESNIPLFMKAVDLVIERAHTSGLTDQISELLKKR